MFTPLIGKLSFSQKKMYQMFSVLKTVILIKIKKLITVQSLFLMTDAEGKRSFGGIEKFTN